MFPPGLKRGGVCVCVCVGGGGGGGGGLKHFEVLALLVYSYYMYYPVLREHRQKGGTAPPLEETLVIEAF